MQTARDVEETVLTMVAVRQDVAPLVQAGVTSAWFTDPACRRGFELQLKHAAEHGKAATAQLYATHALGITPRHAPEDSLDTLVEALRVSSLGHHTRRAASRFIEEVDTAVAGLDECYSNLVSRVTDPLIIDLLGDRGVGGSLVEAFPSFLDRVKTFRDHTGVVGIPFPWPSLNTATGGLSNGDYVVFSGYAKNRKTDVVIEVAVHAAKSCGEPVLLVSNEMSFEDVSNRVACRWAEVSYSKFRRGTLSDAALAHIVDVGQQLQEEAVVQIQFVAATGLAAVAQVRALIERFKPGLVVWDGHSLSADSDDWKDVYQLSRRTRALARDVPVPIIVTAQLNPAKKEMSYKAYHQDATAAIKVVRDDMWLHMTTTEVREEYPVKWAAKGERGMPLVETEYTEGVTDEQLAAVAQGVIIDTGYKG